MEMERKIKLRMKVLLLAGMFSVVLGFWNLNKGGSMDMFAVLNFCLAGFCFWMYHAMNQKFFNKEKPWRSFR